VPGWIGEGTYYSNDNLDYHLDWLYCASAVQQVPIDFMGIWNERGPDAAWTKALRSALDAGGYDTTRIVSGDLGWEIATQMAADPALAEAIDVVGAHYPGQPPPVAYTLNRSLFASEMCT
jgi:hypothetical protein